MKRPQVFLLLTVLLFALSSSVYATDILYTSAAAFGAATMGGTTITFTAPSSTTYAYFNPSYTDGGTGTVYSIAVGGIDLTGKDYYGTGTYSADFLVGSSDGFGFANQLTITPPAGYSAIGLDIGGLFNAATFTVTLSDGATFAISVPASYGTSFFGFSSTSGISSISFPTPSSETFVITDTTIAHLPTSVPEPGTFVMLGTGLVGLANVLRRKVML